MGHQHDALGALRAYARELDGTINDGAVQRVGGTYQDDATTNGSESGAPHQKAISIAASVVLIGAVGIAGFLLTRSTDADRVAAAPPTPTSATAVDTIIDPLPESTSGATAIRALHVLGLPRAVAGVEAAVAAGTHETSDVQAAIHAVFDAVETVTASGLVVSASDPAINRAVDALIELTRPPGLDPNFLPPGQGGVPPGQDENFVAPGQDENFVPPGQDENFVSPARKNKPRHGSAHGDGG